MAMAQGGRGLGMPEEKKPEEMFDAAKGVYILSTAGLQIVISILIGFGFGLWLDRWLGTKPWLMLLFIIFGVAAGFLNVYRIVKNAGALEAGPYEGKKTPGGEDDDDD